MYQLPYITQALYELGILHERHEDNAPSTKKLGTRHPALQGPVLEPGPSSWNRSVHHGDPSKEGGVVDEDRPPALLRFASNGKPTNLARYFDRRQPRKQNAVPIIERGESSRQGARNTGIQPRRISQRTRGSRTAGHPATISRRSITRATLKMGTEGDLLEISTRKIGLSKKHALHKGTGEFALTQSQHDFGVSLRIAKLSRDAHGWAALTWPLELDLFFDPNSDAVLLINKTILDTREMLVIKQLPIVPGKLPVRVGAMEKTALQPTSYHFSLSGKHMFDITVLPRRYAATTVTLRRLTQGKRTVDMLSQQVVESTAKRAKTSVANDRSLNRSSNDQSAGKGQDSTASWKGKEREKDDRSKDNGKGKSKATDDVTDEKDQADEQVTADASNASTIIQRLPSNELTPLSTSSFPSGSELRAGHIPAANHPLAELPQDATIKIANATREEDYTLIRRDNIAALTNTLVFKAHHSKFPGKLVAVKIWRSVFDLDFVPGAGVSVISKVSTHFMRELKNHMRVSMHPAIVKLYGFDVRLLALYMEHVDARDLAKHRHPGRNPYCTLDDSEAERVLNHIADALDFIHSKDVVHNDIKPSNILYTKERGPVLIDFGWSSDTKTVHTAGSPWYIPPEYLEDGRRGPAGDIFAFGVVMLYLMRKIPLPDLLSPPLHWRIDLLRSEGPEAFEARKAMRSWLLMIRKSLQDLLMVRNEGKGGMLEEVVLGITDMDVKTRLTGAALRQFIEEY
ncbi:kinase-like protein [Trichoderma longibrachiatum ATCC 18648]|uniref:Kinase-like protein n=1 Tax=Trichoderma longibrachiatum ATCC 18648 TaxID=983965 RepID=A0A2T4CGC0_TRILO|nr:kinase-like protein [Trichoderma longibrachiatum ATCC 18648]